MSALLVTVARRDRRRDAPPPSPTRGRWRGEHVIIDISPTATGAGGGSTLATSPRWAVAIAGWAAVDAAPDVPVGASGVHDLLVEHGPPALGRLAGEHLLVAVDLVNGRWWAVRDGGGVHAAFWAIGKDVLAIGDAAGEVVRAAGIPRDPDLDHLAALVAVGPPAGTGSPLVGLHRLPGGHVLHGAAPARVAPTVDRWWSPPRPADLDPLDPDALRDVLRDALRGAAIVAGPKPLACELSGGLDSSLLTALAVESARALGAAPPVGITLVHGLGGDRDAPYAAAVADALGLRHHVVPWQARTADDIAAECDGGARLPDPANAMSGLYALARDLGAGALVTGAGGDQWMGGNAVAAFGERVLAPAARRRARRWAVAGASSPGRGGVRLTDLGVRGVGSTTHLVASLARAVVASRVRATTPGGAVLDRRRRRRSEVVAAHVPRTAIARHRVLEHLPDRPTGRWRPGDDRRTLWCDGWEQWALDAYTGPAAAADVLAVVPFWQRSSIIAALAVPEAARWSNGDRRALSRALLPSGIPDIVRHRPDKGDFTALFAAEAMWAPLGPVRTWRLVDHGLVDPDHPGVADLDARAVDDPWPVWQLAAAEWCLRAALADR